MTPAALSLAGILALAPVAATAETWPLGEVVAPSGQRLTLDEVLFEENPWSGDMLVVVRLLAPEIAGVIASGTTLREDADWACDTWGLPAAATLSTPPDFVVVEMMAEPVDRGAASPAVSQVFEQYRLEGPVCIWELF